MVSIEEARSIILGRVAPLPPEQVSLMQGLGRITCGDVHSPVDIPAVDSSAMDGYAFSHAGLSGDRLAVSGFVPAGKEWGAAVAPGEAIKIMTGAPVPSGCDTVVPVEEVEEGEGTVRLTGTVKPGTHIRRRGEDVKAQSLVLPSGTVVRPQEIGMLASLGMAGVRVHRRARVAILATGDELMEAGSVPASGRIVNSNSYSIAAQVREAGGVPIVLGIARDEREATREKILEGVRADVLVTTGGVSVGDRDFVKESIEELGGELLFWKVNMKPGKPVAFATLQGVPVFALPGNPVAAMVAFEMFVRPALLRLMGHARIFRPVIKAVTTGPVRNKGERPHLVRSHVVLQEGKYLVTAGENQSPANLQSLTAANGLMELPPGAALEAGEEVSVSLLDRGFEMGLFTHSLE